MANIPHRCGRDGCRARRVLPRRITAYIRPPACAMCGGALHVDQYRIDKPHKSKGKPCNCDGLHFTHRCGCKGCNYREERVLAGTCGTPGGSEPEF